MVLAKCLVLMDASWFCAAANDGVTARWRQAVPINAKFRKGVFRLWNNFTEENENFTDLAFLDGRLSPLGDDCDSQVSGPQNTDVATCEKGSQLGGRAFPVDCKSGSKV